ncbi:C2 domain-containing protein [Heterostelium album PN500]|uniref:C2 domain-containing protein n=1 Tax=Heterostelium pallidum (strain ATCC 26659 / Pp 5 / PN500) TaxID=670386 RepID=D3AXQ1_HETP5|nr:C2 domain-containing protein [Heterostelium album PN500]EFA85728.1 C2 domain-containing protein [Heterostelium album PN500]|eukprot:XP_020437834.1 C2 domain-containing protein [Heterostelium album PN500]
MDKPVSLTKVDDAFYQQQQNQYEQQQQSIIQQQQLIIQQQQEQLQQFQQAKQNEQLQIQQQLYAQQQQLEQQQLELQRLQFERAQLQSNQLQAQLEKPIDLQKVQEIHQQILLQPPENISTTVSNVNPNGVAAEVANGVLHAPSGSEFVGGCGVRGNLKVRVIRGHNLMVGDAVTNSSDPYVLIKSSCFASHPKTKFISNNLNPVWEETFFLSIESVRTELLMFKVYDHDLVGCDDLLGYFGVNLSLLPIGVEVRTNEKLYFAKHGSIEIAITALDFGLTNIPPNYISTYIDWRNNLVPLERKDFSNLPGTKKTSSFISKTDTAMGPYYCKITHGDFKIIHGYPKLRKTSRQRVAEGFATAGIITAAVFAVIISAPFSGCNHHW